MDGQLATRAVPPRAGLLRVRDDADQRRKPRDETEIGAGPQPDGQGRGGEVGPHRWDTPDPREPTPPGPHGPASCMRRPGVELDNGRNNPARRPKEFVTIPPPGFGNFPRVELYGPSPRP